MSETAQNIYDCLLEAERESFEYAGVVAANTNTKLVFHDGSKTVEIDPTPDVIKKLAKIKKVSDY